MKRLILASVCALTALTGCNKKEPAAGATSASASAGATVPALATGEASKASSSKALAHLADNCDLVLHVDVAGMLAVPAVKKHVVPVLEALKKREPKTDSDKSFDAFIKEAGIDPIADVKEIAVCMTELAGSMGGQKEPFAAVALAGNFKPDSILPSLEKHAKKANFAPIEVDGLKALAGSAGQGFVTQAADGVVVFASTKELLTRAAKASEASAQYQVPMGPAVSVVIPQKFVKEALSADKSNPLAMHAEKAGRLTVALDLNKPALQARLAMADAKSATEVSGVVKMLLAGMTQGAPPPGHPMAPLADLVKQLTVDSSGSETVLDLPIAPAKLDELAAQLATSMSADLK